MKRKHFFKKRALSLLLALTMCMGMMPNAFAADGEGEATYEAGAQQQEDQSPAEPQETDESGNNPSEGDNDLNIQVVSQSLDEGDEQDTPTPEAEILNIDLSDEQNTGTVADADANIDPNADSDVDANADTDTDASDDQNSEWDIKDTQRPDQTDDVSTVIGKDKTEAEKGWSIFYDKETDTYRVNFNIGEDAEGDQTLELSKALELLNKYALDANLTENPGRAPTKPTEPQISEKEKPEEPEEPEDKRSEKEEIVKQIQNILDSLNAELKALKAEEPQKSEELKKLEEELKDHPDDEVQKPGDPPEKVEEPTEPVKPTEPEAVDEPTLEAEDPGPAPGSKPEGYDESVQQAADKISADMSNYAYFPSSVALKYLSEQGLDKNDKNVKKYADYITEKVIAQTHLSILEDPNADPSDINWVINYRSEPYYWENGQKIYYDSDEQRLEAVYRDIHKYLDAPVPEYKIDTTTQAYKDWENDLNAYNTALSEYDEKLAQYNAYLVLKDRYENDLATYEDEVAQYPTKVQEYEDYLKACKAYDELKSKYDEYLGQFPEYEDYLRLSSEYDSLRAAYAEKYEQEGKPLETDIQAQKDALNKAKTDVVIAEEAYKIALKNYQDKNSKYQSDKAEYDKYLADVEQAKKDYEAAIAQYDKDLLAYQAARSAYEQWSQANVMQPGDIRKFEFFFTSDSLHTYQYKDDSFTLATADMSMFVESLKKLWEEDPELYKRQFMTPNTKEWIINPDTLYSGDFTGFDYQQISEIYHRNENNRTYHISSGLKPISSLFYNTIYEDYQNTFEEGKDNGVLSNIYLTQSFDELLEWVAEKYPKSLDKITKELGVEYTVEDATTKEPLYTFTNKKQGLYDYIVKYYSDKDSTTYKNLEDVFANSLSAVNDLISTENNAYTGAKDNWTIEGAKDEFTVGEDFLYNKFYLSLLSFAYGSKGDIDKFLGDASQVFDRWEYDNNSWTRDQYEKALYYYMDHKDAWHDTNAFFKDLLKDGLNYSDSTWVDFMMAFNVDGELTSNMWQLSAWPFFNSIQLEQMDIDFSLTKKDGETGETITDSETGFQVYYIDKVKNDDGTETDVKMYCERFTTEDGRQSYRFVPTASTVWTENGELKIDYAMMKDIVYYLQETVAPEGYALDPNVYIVMNEEDYNKLSDEQKAELEGTFDRFLNMSKSENGLDVSADFINVRIVPPTPGTPDEPDEPTEPDTPDTPDEPTPEIPDEPTPLTDFPEEPEQPTVEVPEEPVPLAEIPEEEVPLAEIPEEPVPLADVPMTGDGFQSTGLLVLFGIAALGWLALSKKRENEI